MNTPAYAVAGLLYFAAILQPGPVAITDRQFFVDGVSAPFTVQELVAAADERGDVAVLVRKDDEDRDVLLLWHQHQGAFPYLPGKEPTQLTRFQVELELVGLTTTS